VPLARGFLSAVAFLGAEQRFPDHRPPAHCIWIGEPGELPPVALTIARIPALTASSSVGQAVRLILMSSEHGGSIPSGAGIVLNCAGFRAALFGNLRFYWPFCYMFESCIAQSTHREHRGIPRSLTGPYSIGS